MTCAFHLLIASIVSMSSPGMVVGGGADHGLPSSRPTIVLIDLSFAQTEVVTHAVALFEEAGLVLPPLVVHGSQGRSACDGRDGLHRVHELGSEIFVCSSKANDWFRRVVLHELAHAWSWSGLTNEHRDAFQVLRGWDHWLNYELAEWRDNGAEQAAEIIAWGVSDQAAPTNQIDDNSCAELRAGYRALTGAEPLHGLTASCVPPRRRITVS